MAKTNPRKIPRSEADVKRAYDKGFEDGIKGALSIMLYTLMDKFGVQEDDLKRFSDAFNYTVDSLNRGYVKEADIRKVIKEEFGTDIEYRQ